MIKGAYKFSLFLHNNVGAQYNCIIDCNDKFNDLGFAPREDSNQPGHPPILSLCYTVHVLNWYFRAVINSFLPEDRLI